MKKKPFFCLLTFTLAYLSPGTDVLAEPFVGHYSNSHEVFDFDYDKKLYRTVADTMVITRINSTSYSVRIDIIANNGHSCTFEGNVVAENDNLVYRKLIEDIPGGEKMDCELRIHFNNNDGNTVLNDRDHKCRLTYCGWRGKLDGTSFKFVK